MSVKPIPEGYRAVTPYLMVEGAEGAIAFYAKAFGATPRMMMPGPGGKLMHAEVQIGDSVVMLADAFPEMGCVSPKSVGGSPVTMHLYVDDVDAVVERAVAEGATVVRPVEDRFYGDRSGVIEDPFGHRWSLATHVEDVTPEEMGRRREAMMAAHA